MNFLTNEPRNRRSWFSQIGSRISHHHNHHHSSSSHHHQSQVNSVIPASNGDGEVKVTSYQVINTGSPVSSLLTTGSSTSTSNTTSFSSSSSPVSNNAHKGTSGGSGRRGSSSADIATSSSSGDGSKSKNRMTTGSPNSPGNKDSGQSKDNSNGSTSGSTLNPNSSSSSGSVSLWQRAASLRRSLGKSQQRKNKLRCSQNSRSSSAIGNNTLSATDVVDSHSSSGNSSNKTITASVSATTVPTSSVTSSKSSGSLSASDVPMIIKGSLICPSGGGSSSSGTDAILGVASTSTSLTKSNPHIGNNHNNNHNNSLLLEASGDEIYGFTASGPNETKTNYLRIGSKSSQISAQVNNNNSINNNNINNNHNNATIGSTTPPIGGSSGSSFNYNNKDGTSSGSPTESVSSNGSTINNNYHQDQNNGCINIAKSVNFNAKSSNKVDTGLSSGETFPSEITSTSTSGKRTSIVSASLSTLSGNSSSTVSNINRTKSNSKGGQRRSAGSGGGTTTTTANNNNRNYSDNKDEISNNSGYNHHHHHHHNYGHHHNNNSNSHHSRVKALSSEMRAATAVSTSNNSSNLTTTSTSWTKADKEFSYFSNKSSTAGSRLSHANGSQSIPSDSQYLNQEVGPGDCLKDGPDWRYLYYRNQYHHHPPPTPPPPPPPPPLPAHHHQNNQSHHLSHQHLNNNQHHHHHHHHHHQHGHSKRYPDDVNSLGYLASSGSAGAPHRLSWSEAINNSNNVTEPGSSNSLLATTARINAPEPDDIDCIYENMKGLTSSSSSSTSVVPSSHSTQLETSLVGQSSNHHCRKLTKDSGYESAASSANWQALTGNSNGGHPSLSLLNHSRSDSNASSVSTGGSLSPRLAATSSTLGNSRSYSYHYFDVWSIAKSTSNLPHQVEKSCPGGVGSGRSSLTRRSSLVMSHKLSLGPSMVLPAKSVPGNLDREPLDTETEEEEIASSLTNLSTLGCGSGSSSITTNGGCCPGGKRSSCSASTTGLSSLPCKCQGNFNSHNLSSGSVYGLLASKSGLDFAPASKVTRKSGFTTENSFMLRHIAGGETNHNNHGIRVSRLNPVSNSCGVGCGENNRLRCNKPDRLKSSCSTPDLLEEDSPPPTPPVRDSSLTASLWSSNQQQRSGGHIGSENGKSRKVDDESKRIPSQRYQSHGSTIKSFMFEGLKSGSNSNGCSRSTLNLRLGTLPFPSESLEQVPPPPLPPPLSSNHTNSDSSPLLDSASLRDYGNPENWSSAGSLVSAYTGHLTSSSLTTTSDYYTASSGAMTSSPSLSSLNTTATTATNGPPVSGISRSIATSGSGPSISSSPPPISYAHYHQYRRHQSHNQQHNRHYHHQCVPSVHHGSTSSGIARSAKVEQPKRQESGSVVYYDSSKSSSSTVSSSSSSSSASSSTTSPTSSSPAAAVVVGSMSTGGGGGRTGQGRPDERKKGSKTMETSGLSRSPIGEEEVSSSSSSPSKSLPLLPQRCPSEKHLQQQPTGSGQSELSTTELKAIQKRALLEYYLKLKKKARKEKKSSESGGEEGEEETEVDQEVDGECDAGEGNHCGHQGEDKVEDDKQDDEEEEAKKKEKAVGEKHPHPHHLHHSHHCPHPFLEKQNQKSDSDCLSKSSSKSSIHLLYKPKAERKTQVGTEEGGEEAEAEAGEEEDQRVEEEISSNKVHLVVAQPSQELESLQYLRPSSSTVVTTTPNNNNASNSSSSLSSAAYSPSSSSSSSSSGFPSPPLPPPPANTETEVITDLPLPSPPFCTSNHSYHQSYNFHPSVGQTLQTPLQPQPQPSSSELESIIPSSCCNPSEKMRSSSSVAVSLEGRLITNPSQQSCLTIISTTTSMSTSASGPPSSESQGKKPISIPGMSANVVHQPTNNNNSSSKDLSSLKSEIATQTTGSLRRGSSPNGQLTNSHHFVGSEKESKVDLNVSLVSTEMNGVSIKEKSSLIVSSDHQSPVVEEQDEENDQCHQGKNKGRNSNNNSNEFSQTVYTRSSPIHLHPSSSPSSKPLSSSSGGGGAPWSHRNLWPGHGLRETNTSPLLLESNNGKKILETYIGPESGQDQENQRPDNQSLSSAMSITTNTTTTTTGQALLLEKDLLERKAELVLKLSRKLDVLRMEKVTLTRDLEANESLGSRLLSELKMSGISESESEKISVHCEEIEKVTRLLLSLSQRLKQIDGDIQEKTGLEESQLTSTSWWSSSNMNNNNNNNNINNNNNNNSVGNKYPQVNSLLTKRCKLLSQLEEAVQLRDSIDRRSQLILDRILRKYFNNENHQEGNLSEFIQFLESKSKLIVELKEVKDKIEFGEKQLQALSKF